MLAVCCGAVLEVSGEGTFSAPRSLPILLPGGPPIAVGPSLSVETDDLGTLHELPQTQTQGLSAATLRLMACALEVLREAAIPLVEGPGNTWILPDQVADGTGVVVAWSSPDRSKISLQRHSCTPWGEEALAIATRLGIRGPTVTVGSGSSGYGITFTQAIATAEDWLIRGHAQRVIVLRIGCPIPAADPLVAVDATAAPFRGTTDLVAGGLLLESAEDCRLRGMIPVAELMAARLRFAPRDPSAPHRLRPPATALAELIDQIRTARKLDSPSLAGRVWFRLTRRAGPGDNPISGVPEIRQVLGNEAEDVTMVAGPATTIVPPSADHLVHVLDDGSGRVGLVAWRSVARTPERLFDEVAHYSWVTRATRLENPQYIEEGRLLKVRAMADGNRPHVAPAPADVASIDGTDVPEDGGSPRENEDVHDPDTQPSPTGSMVAPDDNAEGPPAQREAILRGLAQDVRLRLVQRIPRPPLPPGSLRGRIIMVLGDGPLAVAVRHELSTRGVLLEGKPSMVVDAGASFRLIRLTLQNLDTQPPSQWLALVRLRQRPDAGGIGRIHADGARAGVARNLTRRWSRCFGRILDLDTSMSDIDAAVIACDELGSADHSMEVFRGRERREVTSLVTLPFPPHRATASAGQVVLVAAGDGGITTRLVRELARRFHCRIAMAGGQINGALLDSLRALGSDAAHFPHDITRPDDIPGLLADIRRRFGTLNGCVHIRPLAAFGSLSYATETPERHERRAQGELAFLRHLDPDSWFVSMSSFVHVPEDGDPMELSASEEAVARVCRQRPHSLFLCWPPWEGSSAIPTLIDEQPAFQPIPPDAGISLLLDLLAHGTSGEVMVAGRIGGWTGGSLPGLTHALIDQVEYQGDAIEGRRVFSRASDIWLKDYCLDGVPILPAGILLEMMFAVASGVHPGRQPVGAESVQFRRPIRLTGDSNLELIIRAEPQDTKRVLCTLSTRASGRHSGPLASAILRLGEGLAAQPLPSGFFPDLSFSREAIYQRLFPGNAFQVLREAGAVALEGLLAEAHAEHAYIAAGLLTAPLVQEAAFQAAILHQAAMHGEIGLPVSIDRIVFVRDVDDGHRLSVMAQERVDGSYDVDVDGPEGAVLHVRGIRLLSVSPLPLSVQFKPPPEGWPHAYLSPSHFTQPA